MQLITSFADFAGIMVYILGHPSAANRAFPVTLVLRRIGCGLAGSSQPDKKLAVLLEVSHATFLQAMA
jgi:hypothetical protein